MSILNFHKRDAPDHAHPEETSASKATPVSLITVMLTVAVGCLLLIAGTFTIAGIVGNSDGDQTRRGYCVDQFGDPAPASACR
jgi:hypothetical protein